MTHQHEPGRGQFDPWRKSSYSSGGDNCVEIAVATDGRIGIRDSKNPAQPPQVLDRRVWMEFLNRAKGGEFDLLLSDTRVVVATTAK